MTIQRILLSRIIVSFSLMLTIIEAMLYGINSKNKKSFLQKLLGTIFLILICLSPPQVHAQSNVDSLKTISENVSLSYKERFNTIIELSSFYNYKNVDSSHYYKLQAYDLAKTNADDSLTVKALSFLGSGGNFRNQFDEAIDYLNQALQKTEDMGTSYYLGRIYTDLGKAYDRKGDVVEGLQFLQKALDVHTANKDIYGQADVH